MYLKHLPNNSIPVPSFIKSNIIDDDLNYKVLKTFKIGKCPWMHPNKKEIYSFFNDRIKNTTGKYDKIIEYNARKFMLLVIQILINISECHGCY